ncbi:Sulfoacetaldehyde reductase like protein [Verticillium longisporum]|nr:Sulfoacetaldehyde reductase like protein [Verticillium longisporum]
MASLQGKTAFITGASMGIGKAIALVLAGAGVNVALASRSKDKLEAVRDSIADKAPMVKVGVYAIDIQNHGEVDNAAGLALGAPARFWELPVDAVSQMSGTNVNGVMFTTHSVPNRSMWPRKRGTILNVSSVTGLEFPPFNGEAVYHASKAFLEGFSNSLRNETAGSNIRVLVLRPGVVNTPFHLQRVQYDKDAMEDFYQGYDPLVAEDLAQSALYMLNLADHVSIKALDCVPTAQRALTNFDREWKSRQK